MAYTDYLDTVQSIYIAYYQRPADPGGLRYWAERLDKAGGNLDAIIDEFSTSPESTALYTQTDPLELVNSVYLALFGREADDGVDNFYVKALEAGKFPDGRPATLGRVALDVLNGAQNDDAVAIAHKLVAANRFTETVDGRALTDPDFGTGEHFAATYEGDEDAAAARDFLKAVTSSPATLPSTSDVVSYVQNTIADPGDPIEQVASGKIFTLTQGLDNIVGTPGNDTINAFAFNSVTGAEVTTLNSVDTIDGGAGNDTLNIEVKSNGATPPANYNGTINATIKNVETINIDNTAAVASTPANTGTANQIDASKFVGATTINQIAQAASVVKLAAGTTAGFTGFSTATTFNITPADTAASAAVKLNNVAEGSTVNVLATGTGILNSVKVSGTVADTDTDGTVANTNVAVTVGKDVETLSVNSSVATNLTITDGVGTKKVTTIDASASAGAITYADTETTVATITTGSGNDDVTVRTATSKTAGSVVNASVTTNDGDDKVTVNVTGDGNTTVNTGAGNDTVVISGRGTSVLTVNLGDGSDTFTSSVPINSTDSIDAGAGSDTLLLSLVGAANADAFKNFDVYDVKGMTANLDLDILNTSNSVTEIVGSGALSGAVTLQNVGAGVNFRATADMGLTNVLTLTQKTAGALTFTLDADQVTEVAGDDVAGMSVVAKNATSVTTVFDASYANTAGSQTGESAATDNVSTITLATEAATTLAVVSGGTNAKNVLNVTDNATGDALTSVTITGTQALTLAVTSASKLATIDSASATGGLTAALANLKDGGTIKLGSGTDVITVTATSNPTGAENIEGFAKAAAVAVSTAAADATAKTAAIAAADKLVIDVDSSTNESVANANSSATGATLENGVLTFTGAGPATLEAAVAIADAFAETKGEVVAFTYLGNTYVFAQGSTHDNGTTITAGVTSVDLLVKLVGVTGVTNLVETGTDTFFLV